MSWRAAVAAAAALAVLLAAAAGAVVAVDRGRDLRGEPKPAPPRPEQVARGEVLARAGHCSGCHTARGGHAFAGGRAISTPYGTVYAANLTPDRETGLGAWSIQAFRRALRQGQSADGRSLLPACPYPNFSLVTEHDADDLFAFLRSIPARSHRVATPELRFPYGSALALALWRRLYFEPATLPAGAGDTAWRRGAYLVGGLGHCSACHGRRNAWGATGGAWDLRGGEVPMQGWWAPSLTDPTQGSVATWSEADVVALLQHGRSAQASVSGPMALVVAHSTQHLPLPDLAAMAAYLRSLAPEPGAAVVGATASPAQHGVGEKLYEQHCADCHGRNGQGAAEAGPALAGNRAVTMTSAANVMRMVLGGGFAPATAGNPRPLGMPPFATVLGDEEIAAVVSYVRSAWGHQATSVSAYDVNQQRGGQRH